MGSKETWAFVVLLGAVAFNWPLLRIFGSSLPYALYGFWMLLIVCIWAINVLGMGQDQS